MDSVFAFDPLSHKFPSKHSQDFFEVIFLSKFLDVAVLIDSSSALLTEWIVQIKSLVVD